MDPSSSVAQSTEPIRPFPTTHEDFQTDPRVSWSRLTEKWTLENDDGQEYEYEDALKRWVPVLDESLAEEQSKAYVVDGVDENEPSMQKNEKKRKIYTSTAIPEQQTASKRPKNAKSAKEAPKNRAVYVTNLPPDTNEDELKEVFSKCGVIAEEIDGGRPRIKLYRNDDGTLKGDALVVYFRPESVNLAIQMLDDTDLRFGRPAPEGTMRVQEADFSYKAQKEAPATGKKMTKEKRKIIAKTQKLNNKLADWDDDDTSAIRKPPKSLDRTVVLKNMFTLQELEDDPTAILDIKEDIREECEKLGDVTNVVLYDQEPHGIVTVRFKEPTAAQACVSLMNGRAFGGRQVEAWVTDGSLKFKKTQAKSSDDAEEEARLEKFATWLESEPKGTEEAKGNSEDIISQ